MKKILTLSVLFLLFGPSFVIARESSQIVTLVVTEKGFEPSTVDVKPGIPVTMKVTRKTDSTCATEIKIPNKKIRTSLPLNKEITIEIGKLEKGDIRFACGMDMVSGIIHIR